MALALPLALLLAACADALYPSAPADDTVLDGPIDGLSLSQTRQHAVGDGIFGTTFTPAMGLGPTFVSASCLSCHAGDGKGHPAFDLIRFGRTAGSGFDPMLREGGPQLQTRAVGGHTPESLPAGVTGFVRLNAPSVTGLGLLEAIDDSTIIGLADSADANGDGISGRPHYLSATPLLDAIASGSEGRIRLHVQGYLGRFGKKGAAVDLRHQTVQALAEDMGLTSDERPQELYNPALGAHPDDGVPDPDVAKGTVDALAFYLRTLRPPPRRNRHAPDVLQGESLFVSIGCASCHIPRLTTGRSTIAALDRQPVEAFTDLLLHDMGVELDDHWTEGTAASAEWRTAPLWGLGLAQAFQGGVPRLMHDGRASSIVDAILLHGGEAAQSRTRYSALSAAMQQRVLAYLRSL